MVGQGDRLMSGGQEDVCLAASRRADQQGEAMAEGFRQGLLNVVRERGFVPECYLLQLEVHHGSGTHVWTQSPVIPLTDWVQNNQRSSEWMEKLAKQLNSAEDNRGC